MQLAAEYWSIDIGYKETKQDVKFKRKKKHSINSGKVSNSWKKKSSLEWKTGQAN